MRIYFSGLGGTALTPLAQLALDAGYQVVGSDRQASTNTDRLQKLGVNFSTNQSGAFLQQTHEQAPIDWLIYTSALPADHPELLLAQKLGIKTTKRDQFIPWFIKQHNFTLIAVAGAHGKTSTTTMLIWLFHQLNLPISYLVGSNLPFAPAGRFASDSHYFIYECDEYDRNFLHYQPAFSLIPAVDYDHIDIYPTIDSYRQAFNQFFEQSQQVIMWPQDRYPGLTERATIHFAANVNPGLELLGQHNRANAQLILELISMLNLPELTVDRAINILNQAPRAERRFEALLLNLISDYAHHPKEIQATLELAQEYVTKYNFRQIITVYEPHQNDRQIQFQADYPQAFAKADTVYWLPTYVARDHHETVLGPEILSQNIKNVVISDFNSQLITKLRTHLQNNDLVILMSAGKLDSFIRSKLATLNPNPAPDH